MIKKLSTSTLFALFLIILLSPSCSKEQQKIDKKSQQLSHTELTELYKKTGWISDNTYRTGIYIITNEEFNSNSKDTIKEKIAIEAEKHLHRELNPSFNRNISARIKILMANNGKIIYAGESSMQSHVYIYEIEKNNLKKEFDDIKNMK
ncbi:MAG: hypothetical protein BWY23_02033 [Spirochaetes bacterium ADurb.Bin218]|mgnify:FL=1|jgi:hypothetical protein|nr:MAG: hypothetical protein BWY23_02033 [Spirochaetes bacterium ADurb.Bin218]HOQ12189.1 hypothetical protein [Spirochaetota bacterium]HPX91834.1 hypothetical protein [Spirochaetota bacterium]